MGALEKIFGKLKTKKEVSAHFKMLDGYTPIFSTYDGGVYEMEENIFMYSPSGVEMK